MYTLMFNLTLTPHFKPFSYCSVFVSDISVGSGMRLETASLIRDNVLK